MFRRLNRTALRSAFLSVDPPINNFTLQRVKIRGTEDESQVLKSPRILQKKDFLHELRSKEISKRVFSPPPVTNRLKIRVGKVSTLLRKILF